MTGRIHCKGANQRRKRLAKLKRERRAKLWADLLRVFLGKSI